MIGKDLRIALKLIIPLGVIKSIGTITIVPFLRITYAKVPLLKLVKIVRKILIPLRDLMNVFLIVNLQEHLQYSFQLIVPMDLNMRTPIV